MRTRQTYFWKTLTALLLGTFACALNPVKAQTLKVILGTIPYVYHPEQHGPHNELVDILVKEAATADVSFSVQPYYRAFRNFTAQAADCLYVAINDPSTYLSESNQKGKLRFSRPVNQIELHAFTRPDDPLVHTYADLKNQAVIGVRTQLKDILSTLLQAEATIINTLDHTKAFALLDRGRAYTVITYAQDAKILMDNLPPATPGANPSETRPYVYDPNFILQSNGEVMACWVSPASDVFLNSFNERFNQLQANGKIAAVFDKF